MLERRELFPHVIEMNYQARRRLGCCVYLVHDGGEWLLIDIGYEDTVREIVDLIRQLDPDWVPPVGHRMGLAFECASPAEVDAAHRRLVDAGFASKKEPWDAFWGQRYAQLVDPDDNVVDLFAQLPTTTS